MTDKIEPELGMNALTVWVVEQIEDHAAGWIWGVFSTKEAAEKWCKDEGQDCVHIEEHEIDERVREFARGFTLLAQYQAERAKRLEESPPAP